MALLNVEDLINFEQDPIRQTVEEEVGTQAAVGNGQFANGDEEQPRQQPQQSTFQDPETMAANLANVFDMVQPRQEVDELDRDQEQRLTSLERREARLSQIPLSNEPVSRRIQGNPFSIQLGPGLRQGFTAAINRERQRRVQGDPDAVDRADRRMQNLQGRSREIARELSETDDDRQRRRLEREQRRIRRRMSRANRRRDRYSGFEGELTGLREQQTEAELARESNRERADARQEFVTENVGEAVQEQVQTQGDIAQERVRGQEDRMTENLEALNEYQLQDRLYNLKGNLEQSKASLGTAQGRKEYSGAVNAYVRTFLQTADKYDDKIRSVDNIIENQSLRPGKWYYTQEEKEAGAVPEGVPDDLIAPQGVTRNNSPDVGDPQYLDLQQQKEAAQEEKDAVIQQALDIYENSTVVGEGTRYRRPPTEQDKELVEEMKRRGIGDSQIATFAEGMGFEYDPSEFEDVEPSGSEGQGEEEGVFYVTPETTVDDALNFYEEQRGVSRDQILKNIKDRNNLETDEEARNYMQRQLEQTLQDTTSQ